MEKILLKPLEVAEAIGVSRSRVYDLIGRGELPSIRVGGVVRVPVQALRDWVSDQMGAKSRPVGE
jgi:excisionase family DNA binding protein